MIMFGPAVEWMVDLCILSPPVVAWWYGYLGLGTYIKTYLQACLAKGINNRWVLLCGQNEDRFQKHCNSWRCRSCLFVCRNSEACGRNWAKKYLFSKWRGSCAKKIAKLLQDNGTYTLRSVWSSDFYASFLHRPGGQH